jgi:hypothetical protein
MCNSQGEEGWVILEFALDKAVARRNIMLIQNT